MGSNYKAYIQGYEAAGLGLSVNDNPYVADDAGHWNGKWRQGFTDATQGSPRRMSPSRRLHDLPCPSVLPSQFRKDP